MTEFDCGAAFREAFDKELLEARTDSGVDYPEWRAGGRASKAHPNKEDYGWWSANGPTHVENWVSWREGLPNYRIWVTPAGEPAIELGLLATIGGVSVKMFIDRIFVDEGTGELVILDIKTGARTPESDLQLGFYRVGVLNTLGVEANLGGYWMSRQGGLSPMVDLSRFTDHMIGSMLQQFNRAVENEIFIPHLTNLCKTCSVNRACYAFGGDEAHRYDPMHPDYNLKAEEAK